MFKKTSVAVGLLLALAAPVAAQQELKAAMVAAMGEAIEDDRYPGIIEKYGLPAPDLSNPTLVNSHDHPSVSYTHLTLPTIHLV